MDTEPGFVSPRICSRNLGFVESSRGDWPALESRLEAFCQQMRDLAVPEDEAAATKLYVQHLAEAGFLDLMVPAAYRSAAERPGNPRGDAVSSLAICLTRQWLSRVSGALDTAFVMQGLGSYPVTLAGTDALKQALLPRVATGQAICAFALTEPGAGSDIKAMQTTAHPQADGSVVLEGSKCFISNAGVADSYVVFAREGVTDGEPPPVKPRFGAFWIPGDSSGLRVQRTRVIAPHPIGKLFFEGLEVPAGHRLGVRGQGLRIALGNLDVFRVSVGAAALGLADEALAVATKHLRTRVQFGKPLAAQQGLQFALADVATDHLAAQLLVYRAACARDADQASPDQAAMAKMFATESAQRAIDRAVQCLGGLGVTVGETPERLYREIRALRIYEGTTEIQKLIIARALLRP